MKYVIWPEERDRANELGGKAAALAALADEQLPIPMWFAVAPCAFDDSLTDEQRDQISDAEPAAMAKLLDKVWPSTSVIAEINDAFEKLEEKLVAVRSSAIDEDSSGHSFAGQLDSFVYIDKQRLPDRVAAVWRSGFNHRVLSYRKEHGLSAATCAPAVLVQTMIDADAAGVAFSVDPVKGRRDVAVVNAVYGLGTALVSGESDADTYFVNSFGNVIERKIAHKAAAHRRDKIALAGFTAKPVDDNMAERAVLSEEQIELIAKLVRTTSDHFGKPQDIEWAIDDHGVYLLQSRPITSLPEIPDEPDGSPASGFRRIWDNSNIAESYAGVTTPLTFSFARRSYEEVYREFCRIMKVPDAKIRDNTGTFANMLGLIRGRVYYNLLNWYRVLALLPGFKMNRKFMEQMMGVKEAMPDDVLAELAAATIGERFTDSFHLMRSMWALRKEHRRLKKTIDRFYERLDGALGNVDPPLTEQSLDQLAAYYRTLESKLLTRWDAPLVNDFLAMIFFGLLARFTKKWCKDESGTLHNDLLCDCGEMISAEPARLIEAMSREIFTSETTIEEFCVKNEDVLRAKIDASPSLKPKVADYLDRFGDRCLEELKLESATLADDPMPLYRSIGYVARRLKRYPTGRPGDKPDLVREKAERRASETVGGKPIRSRIYNWTLRHARDRVRDRENMRFERTRVFGRVRQIFVEMGKRLHANGLLNDPRDVFYLELNEVLGYVEGTLTGINLKVLSLSRKAEFEDYQGDTFPPAQRFETFGPVYLNNRYQAKAVEKEEKQPGDTRSGIGCCAGLIAGRVRVITDPRNADLRSGDILVAARTDPGWIMLFPAATGIVVEHGSMLSHSAIVARELGIPCVVSVPGLMSWLKTGDQLELDGSAGTVKKVRSHAVTSIPV